MKRIISILLVAVMALGLCACGDKTAKNDEIPTLVWYVHGETPADLNAVMDAANEILVEKIGAKLEMRYISGGSFQEKMRMIMAAREEFDLCFTGFNNSYADAVDNSALYDITDLIEETTLRDALPAEIFEIAEVDGRIYGIPNQQIFSLPYCLVVRKDLAEKYNLDMSDFTESADIEPFLETIKQNEPEYYPISTFHKLNTVWFEGEERLATIQGIEIKKVGENDWEVLKPDFSKEANLTYKKSKQMNDWYKKGYIRKDADTVPDDASDLLTGRYAVTIASYKPGVESELKTQVNGDVVTKVVSQATYSIDFPLATMISVSATTKYPELCVKFIELINTDIDFYNLICYGIEDKHYTKIADNRIEFVENSTYQPNACWMFGNNFNAWLTPGQPDDCHEQSKELNASAEIIGIPGFVFDNTNVKMEITQVATVKDKYMSLQLGTIDPDNIWDNYAKELEQAGIFKVYEEVNKQVEEYEKTLK